MVDLLKDRDAWSTDNCSVTRALEVVGTRSALLVMREAFLGTSRFHDFSRRIGIGEPAVAARLRELTAAGLLERTPYREPGRRTRDEYRLTPKGRDFYGVILALREWGDTWATDGQGPPWRSAHRGCGAEVHTVMRCADGHDVQVGETTPVPGPGLVLRE
jgi:DNA-binding HxlR family transcriptional regulator